MQKIRAAMFDRHRRALLSGVTFLAAGLVGLPPCQSAEWELLADLDPGPASSRTMGLSRLGNLALFEARVAHSQYVWRTDGTSVGTHLLLKDLYSAKILPMRRRGPFALVAGWISDDYGLYVTDGTGEGTRRLELGAIEGASFRAAWLSSPLRLLFGAVAQDGVASLHITDGTAEGTRRVGKAALGGHTVHGDFTAGDKLVAFIARDRQFRHSIWISDGTDAGTRMLLDPADGYVHRMTAKNDSVFALLGRYKHELWKWRAGVAARVPVEGTLLPIDYNGIPAPHMTAAGGRAFFVTDLGGGVQRLWVSDATLAGTTALLTLAPPERFETFEYQTCCFLAAFDGRVAFVATTAAHGREAWTTDGTPEGTRPLDVCPGPCSSLPTFPNPVVTNAGLFLTADDGVAGLEIWWSDGTPESLRRVADLCPGPCSSSPSLWADLGATWVVAANDGTHGELVHSVDSRTGAARLLVEVPQTPPPYPGLISIRGKVGTRVIRGATDELHGQEPWAFDAYAPCVADDATLCLGGGRFAVRADWKDFAQGRGFGHAVQLTADTGYFWFFGPENVEVVVKVLDGTPVNGEFWTFYGALSSVEYGITVSDTIAGVSRRFWNPPGRLASVGDVETFGPNVSHALAPAPSAAVSNRVAPQGSCVASPTRLCLNGGRFAVEARWTDFSGNSGEGKAVPLTADTGYFWFFGPDNVEVVLKLLDGRPVNGKFWVFYGALSSVEYGLTVTDTETGAQRVYRNPSGTLASRADTSAF
jgi:ELWxxDGT repeat protein